MMLTVKYCIEVGTE